jgi:hypothetical protein
MGMLELIRKLAPNLMVSILVLPEFNLKFPLDWWGE